MIDYDKMAAEYARHRHVHPEVLRGLLTSGGVRADCKVLEVGCGTGNYVASLQSLTGCSCWGIDPSQKMLDEAQGQSARVTFQRGTATEIPFPDGFFDLVFCVDVIHHVAERQAYFQEAHRVLRSNGKVCTVTDSEWIIRHRQPLALYFPETVEADLKRYPRVSELRDMMEQVGFGDIVERTVEFSYNLTDISAYRDKTFSCLHLISDKAFQEGIRRMECDLGAGPIECVSRYLLLWGTKQAHEERRC
jgi:ubiquinone/menaquinone biosynthesis C-methylase UbiE